MRLPTSSALDPAGIQSERIAALFWGYVAITTVVFVLVIGAFVVAVTRRRSPGELAKRELPTPASLLRKRIVGVATLLTSATLVIMLVMSVMTSRAVASLGGEDVLRVKVTAHKWWWEFTYPAGAAALQFTTAYEMHIPVGRVVEVDLGSVDVIHSFWVPSLHGKRDAIPGQHSSLFLRAERAGTYEGQCAEFCGVQHANMRFIVVAESETDFRAWAAHAIEPAPPPDDPAKRRGQQVFMSYRCVTCHAIGGTEAFGTVGPNLTHLASRRDIGMGTLPNTQRHLSGWIADPQATKPGVAMPSTALDPADLNALVAYLGSLR
jgi:cytochrome c oxidase subunit 2